jgi:hypothetical protein
VWNVFTCGYFETNFWVMLADVAALLYLGRRIEPVWGARVRRSARGSAFACVCGAWR